MSARESLNHALFHDVLSGEFRPACDPKQRVHTLGRLLIATFQKGEVLNPKSHRETHTYSPSWAEGLSSTVTVSHWDIKSLELDTNERKLLIEHTFNDRSPRQIIITDTGVGEMPLFIATLDLSSDLSKVRSTVTRIGSAFFSGLN